MGNGGICNNFQRLFPRRIARGDENAARAEITDTARELPCVNAGYSGNVVFLKQLRKRFCITEIRRSVVAVINNKAADSRIFTFKVVIANSVISDERIGHYDQLIGI